MFGLHRDSISSTPNQTTDENEQDSNPAGGRQNREPQWQNTPRHDLGGPAHAEPIQDARQVPPLIVQLPQLALVLGVPAAQGLEVRVLAALVADELLGEQAGRVVG